MMLFQIILSTERKMHPFRPYLMMSHLSFQLPYSIASSSSGLTTTFQEAWVSQYQYVILFRVLCSKR